MENQEAPACEDSLSSQLVKPHPGLAAAIARVLSGEQETDLCVRSRVQRDSRATNKDIQLCINICRLHQKTDQFLQHKHNKH